MIEIDYKALKEVCNIRAVVFDKDNTLTAPYALEIHPFAQVGFQNALDTFGRNHVAILSNSAGTKDDEDYKDAIEIENSLDIPVIRHDEKKPGGLQQVLQHFQLEDPSQICMIGDRLLTDVVFGTYMAC
jgi:phosphatidylglycerophosphatase GEP4